MLSRTKNSASDSLKTARLGRKLAALAGATGAVAAGTAEAVPYTPTAGVAAAQGIPGFSFNTSTNTATLGSLRPPASTGVDSWDIDGVGGGNFNLQNRVVGPSASAILEPISVGNSILGLRNEGLLISNLATGAVVNATRAWSNDFAIVTSNGFNRGGANFEPAGQFGFRFLSGSDTFYGWGSMVVDETPVGQGFKITEAYYQTTPGAAIAVGAVPVPEPSSMALLAIGAAGVTAWRARRKQAK